MTYNDLQTCVFETWSPVIGDPTIMGWVTVVAYGISGLFCALVLLGSSKQRVFWGLLALFLLLLAINKQLDLQSALTAAGRCAAHQQGWYDDRRNVQIIFILSLTGISALVALRLAWALRKGFGQVWMALAGIIFLLTFIVIRAAGFHHFDALIMSQINGVRMNWILELSGIGLIALNAGYLVAREASEP